MTEGNYRRIKEGEKQFVAHVERWGMSVGLTEGT